jgi:hypothetical protein
MLLGWWNVGGWVRHVARGDEKCLQNFDWKALKKRPVGRPRIWW